MSRIVFQKVRQLNKDKTPEPKPYFSIIKFFKELFKFLWKLGLQRDLYLREINEEVLARASFDFEEMKFKQDNSSLGTGGEMLFSITENE